MKKCLSKTLALLLAVLMLVSVCPFSVSAETEYYVYLTYADIQAEKSSLDQRYGINSNDIAWQQLPTASKSSLVYLAKNEHEGFQLYFYENSDSRNLSVSVTPFVNAEGKELTSRIYKEEYLATDSSKTTNLADVLIPYDGTAVVTQTNTNNMFYIELVSDKDQPAGNYTATVTLYDGGTVLTTKSVTAVVWNFSLPESHYGTLYCGLYNSVSGYSTTNKFLRLCGIKTDANGEVVAEDVAKAEEILEGWQEFLLEYGLTTYEIPRWLIDTDAKEAELTMADPRRKLVTVPILNYHTDGNTFSQATEDKILQYKNLMYNNKFLKDKAMFYYCDEPGWKTEADTAGYLKLVSATEKLWANHHSMVPINSEAEIIMNTVKENSDIFCVNHDTLRTSTSVKENFASDTWTKKLRYQGSIYGGNSYLQAWGKSPIGVYRRVMFWQSSLLNSDGILHWNCAYVPNTASGEPYDVFDTMVIPSKSGVSTGNGDGILVYAGATIGQSEYKPLASLRLMQLSAGLDDMDYLELAKEFLGEDSDAYQKAVKSVFGKYTKDTETGVVSGIYYAEDPEYAFITWECNTMNDARIALGNALSAAANTEHNYGEWEVAVTADATHQGMKIRTCSDCGTQESCRYSDCDIYGHYLTEYTDNNDGTHTAKCGLCDYQTSQGHSYETKTINPTCTAKGYDEHTCTLCKASYKDNETDMAEHSYVETVIAPTCTTKGYTEYVCSVCQQSYRDSETQATGHRDENTDGICDVCNQAVCDHLCHKTGFLGIVWKFINLFNKLFKINQVCDCGAKHW